MKSEYNYGNLYNTLELEFKCIVVKIATCYPVINYFRLKTFYIGPVKVLLNV